ncbi:FAD-dependent monooxygenase [Aromatoleum toluclasticum]|uniref:FAD-dependent monooxygenase n=1 Tax=Aromatoleum toluclasticum TaxID=92003 RepID=UPI001D18181B|nr:FAD-dependent monooxygenase [Aromatoleum toluclasticum]MCC4116410.1 FAD-dependent monooxygenase [Aromatoleum toluclasticum]
MAQHDLLIVGAGPVGLSLALALKDSGLAIALADTRARDAVAADPRALALAHGSRLTLERLGVWHDLPATPIRHIHVSQQGGFGRTRLEADDYGLPALGYVVQAGALAGALRDAVDRAGITVMDQTEVAGLAAGSDSVTASLAGTGAAIHGTTAGARLVACAEGGPQAGAPDIVERDYGQHALIAHVGITGSHGDTAFERFTSEGPIALLPHGDEYALVHVASPRRATELLALPDAAYLEHLQHRFGSRVHLARVTGRLRYPLVLRYRSDPVGQRTVWLGNAAQTLHPVAGQGFNLALRDVWALARTLLDHGGDPGLAGTLAAWRDARRVDRFGAINFTDSLVRIFSNDSAPLHHARGAALFALDMLPPLRHFIARRMMFGARAWP